MATTTTTATATTATSSVPMRNPKDSMKSTWHEDKSQWGIPHHLLHILGIDIAGYEKNVPVHQKTDSMPHLPQWYHHRWILAHALWPVAVHKVYEWYFGTQPHVIAVFLLYSLAFKINGIREIKMLARMGKKYGFLDGDKHERDQVPDHSVLKVVQSLLLTSNFRPMMSLMLAWSSQAPTAFSWWLPLEIGIYSVVLDFWFYWYHRLMHQFDSLWKYHRTHHLTKHPNPLLTLYADHEQEFLDIVGIPLLTWGTMKLMGFPMGFYDWWICHQYLAYSEIFGHSGLRIDFSPPSTIQWLLAYFDMELTVEDHDLHHRKGWKKSHNYGKQTRVWDQLFSTTHERYETLPGNIDYAHPISMPVF